MNCFTKQFPFFISELHECYLVGDSRREKQTSKNQIRNMQRTEERSLTKYSVFWFLTNPKQKEFLTFQK